MQPTYCRVAPTFWTDPDVKRPLTRDQKLLALYYFTSPHTNMIGLYYCPFEYVAAETGLAIDDVREWTLGPLAKFATYDLETEEILVHRAARHQIGEQLKPKDNRVGAIERILHDTHSAKLVGRFRALYPDWPIHFGAPSPNGKERPAAPVPEGPPKPLPSPSEALAVAVTDAVADADAVAATSHARAPVHTREEADALASRLIVAANRGMQDNPAIGIAHRPIPTGHASREKVVDWLTAGVPCPVIERTVYEVAKEFKPHKRDRQISSMNYFEGAVLDAWEAYQAATAEVPSGTSGHGTRRRRDRRTDPGASPDYGPGTAGFDPGAVGWSGSAEGSG